MQGLWTALAVTALALVAPHASAKPAAKAQIDWTRRVAATPQGGYVMGNPRARLHLVEYGSLTCNHCANFERDGAGPLMAYVRSGKLRFEFRNWVRDPLDVAAGLAARCGGARRVFAINHRLFATQSEWLGRVSDDDYERAEALDQAGQMKSLAHVSGIDTIAINAGVPSAKLAQCLSNRAEAEKLTAIRNSPQGLAVEGTPTFFLNGVEVIPTEMNRWPRIEAAIKVKLAR